MLNRIAAVAAATLAVSLFSTAALADGGRWERGGHGKHHWKERHYQRHSHGHYYAPHREVVVIHRPAAVYYAPPRVVERVVVHQPAYVVPAPVYGYGHAPSGLTVDVGLRFRERF